MHIKLFHHQQDQPETKKFNINTFGNFIFENKKKENLFPKIFYSRKPYNPIFACDAQIKYLKKNDEKIEKIFSEKISRTKNFLKKSILNEPRPPSNNKYCSVCHIRFDNYIIHINSKNHKLLFKNSNSYFSLKIIQKKIFEEKKKKN